ncbi:anthrone oxygenase family protein [Xanthobacter sp. KR7-225]|uniref:anthrone oxygenase family protein n=1 Tax=Xanthobacter sp. KR7-225 TaxID=3156613 RepID=UPI0032B3CCCC
MLNPLFFLAFFGTAALALAVLWLAFTGAEGAPPGPMILGAALYLLGSILVTIAGNVPLNGRLAALSAAAVDAAAWSAYRGPWMLWNHVRTLASLAAAACFAAALALA